MAKQASQDSGIIRVEKGANPYKMIATSFASDTRLSWGARGVMVYLLSKSDNWKVHTKDLIKQSPAGRDAVYRILKELETHGYLKRVRTQLEDGTFQWFTTVYEVPQQQDQPCTDNPEMVQPLTDKPDTDKPDTEKPHIYLRGNEPKKELRESATPAPVEQTIPEKARSTENPEYRQRHIPTPKTGKQPNPIYEQPLIKAVQSTLGYRPTATQCALILDSVTDLRCWQDALTYWAANNYRADSIGKIINRYQETQRTGLGATVHGSPGQDQRPRLPDGSIDYDAMNEIIRKNPGIYQGRR